MKHSCSRPVSRPHVLFLSRPERPTMTRVACCLAIPFALCVVITSSGCGTPDGPSPTSAEAHQFVEAAEKRLETLSKKASRTGWVQNNFITVDTQRIAADAQSDLAAAVTDLALGARRFEGLQLSDEDSRKLRLLKLQLAAP